MDERRKSTMPLVVDWGKGPHIYAGEVVGVMFDGAAINITFGNLESRIARKDDTPSDPPVVAVCGKLSLSPHAAIQAVNILNKVLGAIQASGKAEAHTQRVN